MKDKNETKNKIAQAAIRLFPEQGYVNTSMRKIAEAVGISKPALYYYFKNKDELFKYIVDVGNQYSQKKLIEIKDSDLPIEEKLKQLVWTKFSLLNQHENVKKFSGWLMSDGLKFLLKLDMKQEITKQIVIIFDIIESGIEKGELRKDLDKESFVYLLFGAANIYANRHYVFGDPVISDKQVDELIKTLMNSAK
jgi:AcrR family transcriptional regulator